MNYKPLNRNIYSSNLKVLGLLYISPHSSCGKIRRALVRALKYYHRYMSEHPELRKGRRRLVIPFEDNSVGKELSAA